MKTRFDPALTHYHLIQRARKALSNGLTESETRELLCRIYPDATAEHARQAIAYASEGYR
jgi:alkylhydroperoxidase/carboxymuconolactone decarboxylase family protein YurZ